MLPKFSNVTRPQLLHMFVLCDDIEDLHIVVPLSLPFLQVGVGLLCHNPTGNGIVTRLLESVNGVNATIIQISESENATRSPSVTKLSQTLSDTDEAILRSIFSGASDNSDEEEAPVHEK